MGPKSLGRTMGPTKALGESWDPSPGEEHGVEKAREVHGVEKAWEEHGVKGEETKSPGGAE